MKIKQKLIMTFTLVNIFVFTAVVISTSVLFYNRQKESIKRQIRDSVNTTGVLLDDKIRSSATSTITTTLKQLSLTLTAQYKSTNIHKDYKELLYNSAEAIIHEAKLAKTGYVLITDAKGKILIHPNKNAIGDTILNINELEKVPVDTVSAGYHKFRDKEVYSAKIYLEVMNWYLIATVPVEEFEHFINLDSYKDAILSVKVGDNGYTTLISNNSKILVHPVKAGSDVRIIKDAHGNLFLKDLATTANNFLEYQWADKDGYITNRVAYHMKVPVTGWTILSVGLWDDFHQDIKGLQYILIIATLIALTINIIAILIISRAITSPIEEFNEAIKEISEGDGDLTRQIEVSSKDELAAMADSFNTFVQKLCEMIKKIKESTEKSLTANCELVAGTEETSASLYQITRNISSIEKKITDLNLQVNKSRSSVSDITGNINNLNEFIETQTSMIEESTASITQMTKSVAQVANITESRRKTAQSLLETAVEGGTIINETLSSVHTVSKQLENINEMATVISKIAASTNLLAMNAAIEAAHAGEAGKGFAVVADEIRKLAESSNQSSRKIQEILKNALLSMDKTIELSEKSGQSFQAIDIEIKKVTEALDEIHYSADELHIGGSELLEAITMLRDLSETVNENSASIKIASSEVNKAMGITNTITQDVVNAIEEITAGTDEISRSMKNVTNNTTMIADHGNELNNKVDDFKTA